MNFRDLIALHAYGTSEGAVKGWEVRDRRSVTEYYPGSPARGTKTTYGKQGSNDNLYVTETARRAKVEEHTGNAATGNRIHTVHDGTPQTATKFLKEKYGIDHKRD